MSVIHGLAAASALLSAAGDVMNGTGPIVDGAKRIGGSSGMDLARRAGTMAMRAGETNTSLAQYTAQTAIRNRAFIDGRIAQEDVLPNLLRACRSWYLAQVLSALQLQQLVTKGRTVQDVFGIVQTGDNPHFSSAAMGAFQRMAGVESLMCNLGTPNFLPTESTIGCEALGAAAIGILSAVGPDIALALLKAGMNRFRVGPRPDVTASPPSAGLSTKEQEKLYQSQVKAQNKYDADVRNLQFKVAEHTVTKMIDGLATKLNQTDFQRFQADLAKAKTVEDLDRIATKYGVDAKNLETEIQAYERKIGLDKAMAEAKLRSTVAGPSTISADKQDLEVMQSVATGDLYMVTLTNPEHPERSVQVPILLQMLPLEVPAPLMPRLIDRMVMPSVWQRWTQMTIGEISFFSDFIGQADLLHRHTTPSDPEQVRVLKTFLKTINNKDAYSRSDIASARPTDQMSKNLANTVMVFSEDAVLDAYADSGIDLRNESDRQRYFRDTYTMIIAIVDPAHQKIETYINGVDGPIHASYSDFKPKQKNFDPTDLLASLSALSQGRRPPL